MVVIEHLPDKKSSVTTTGLSMTNSEVNSLARIRSRLPNLAVAERQVADWVLQNSEDVISSSMAQVALECGVSDTTVLRFCRAAGFKGYMDLKLSIARDLASPTQMVHDDIAEGDSPAIVARKVFTSHIQALYDTLEVLDQNKLARAVDMILKAILAPIYQQIFHGIIAA